MTAIRLMKFTLIHPKWPQLIVRWSDSKLKIQRSPHAIWPTDSFGGNTRV